MTGRESERDRERAVAGAPDAVHRKVVRGSWFVKSCSELGGRTGPECPQLKGTSATKDPVGRQQEEQKTGAHRLESNAAQKRERAEVRWRASCWATDGPGTASMSGHRLLHLLVRFCFFSVSSRLCAAVSAASTSMSLKFSFF